MLRKSEEQVMDGSKAWRPQKLLLTTQQKENNEIIRKGEKHVTNNW